MGCVLPKGRRMDQITKTPTVCHQAGLAVLGEDRQETQGRVLSGAHSP